ncbi:hypothetical protein CCACVL1_07979 [Corchorus capsularis]|uniref:Chalcone synthase n=1 Tax=Corchorus capsularis TaxID=210143 RepID=A0A1R3J345_COCAP|nr:hypothetical protein CCACVL1_07979 [Corchorus capsularis]
MAMATVEEIRKAQRADGVATILSIATANPPNCISQSDYPDFYFRVTNSSHLTYLKNKFIRMCDRTMIKKRYFHMTEEMLKANPSMCTYMAPSLDARQDITVEAVPKLGQEAAAKAIKEWLLDLSPSVKRFMVYLQGCFAGGTALRLAKDLAENNKGARVLVVCSEILALFFRGVSETETNLDYLVGSAIFSDGAAAVIVGADPDPVLELIEEFTRFDRKQCRENYYREFSSIGSIKDWNSIFYVVHPGGRLILDLLEAKLGLEKHKLRATRHVLSEFGNMSSASVLFVLDEMCKKCMEEGKATTGEGLEWGVLLGLGPGLTAETVVLHSIPIKSK